MGSGCSSPSASSSAAVDNNATGAARGRRDRHHHENEKNRLNPTEKVENWKEKMLLDIGADPLSVIRDFPRMNVFFIAGEAEKQQLTRQKRYCDYHVDEGDHTNHPHPKTKTNTRAKDTHKTDGKHRKESTQAGHSHKERYAADSSGTTGFTHSNPLTPHGRRASSSSAVPTGPFSSLSRPLSGQVNTNNNNRNENEQNNEGMAREQKLFAARRRRLQQSVSAIAALVEEEDTFGKAFADCWAEKERECFFAATASSPSMGTLSQPTGAMHASSHTSLSKANTGHNHSLLTPFISPHGQEPDIHQLFQAVCIESGMLIPYNALSGDDHAQNSNNSNANVSSSNNISSGVNAVANSRTSRLPSRNVSVVISPPVTNAIGFSSGMLHTVLQSTNSSNSSTNVHPVPAPLSTMNAVGGATSSPISNGKVEYLVASATFHVMQYIVQGVMFFPFQRLKHVFWFPWAPSSLFSDVDWKVFVYVEENVKSVANFIYEKKLTHSAHKRGMQTDTSTNTNANNITSECPTEASPLLGDASHELSICAEREVGVDVSDRPTGLHVSKINNANALNISPPYGASADTSPAVSTSKGKSLLVIKHLQIVRHFVEASETKKVPKYELDWTCATYLDKNILEQAYQPFSPFTNQNDNNGNINSNTTNGETPVEDHSPFTTLSAQSSNTAIVQTEDNNHITSNTAAAVGRSSTSGLPPRHNAHTLSSNNANGGHNYALSGVKVGQQPRLVSREAVFADIDIVGARVEKVPKGCLGPPKEWAQHTAELAFVLQEQYGVELEEVPEMKNGRYSK